MEGHYLVSVHKVGGWPFSSRFIGTKKALYALFGRPKAFQTEPKGIVSGPRPDCYRDRETDTT